MSLSKHILPVVAAFFLVVGVNLWWNAEVQRVPSWDQSHHLTLGIEYARAITNCDFVDHFMSVRETYPPGYHLLLALGTLMVGPSPALGLFVNMVMLLLLMLATFQIGKRIGGSHVGSLAAVLVALYPGMVVFSREALIDFSLSAVTAASMAAALKCNGFEDRRASVVLGLLSGCGLLFKPSFAFYVWLPMAIAAVPVLIQWKRRNLINLLIAASCCFLVAATWYVPHWSDNLRLAQVNRADAMRWGHPASAWEGARVYLESLGNELMTGVGAVVAGVSLLVGLRNGVRRLWLPYAWIFGTGAILVLVLIYRDPKYLLPMLPAMAVLVADAVMKLRPMGLRIATIVAVVGVNVLALGPVALGMALPPAMGTINQYAGVGGGESWSIPEIVAEAAQHASTETTLVGVVPDLQWFNGAILTWQARRVGAPLYFFLISDSGRYQGPAFDARKLDMVLLKTGTQGEQRSTDLAGGYIEQVRAAPQSFRLIRAFPLADGTQAELYLVSAPGR